MSSWLWDESAHRYRSASTGRFLSPTTEAELRAAFVEARRLEIRALGRGLGDGSLTVNAFRRALRDEIEALNGVEYMFGRGGRRAMTLADRQALSAIIAQEWAYADNFAIQAAAGGLSAGQIEARAAQYAAAGHKAAEAGRMASYEGFRAPAMPGVGTVCRSNCRCSWAVTETEDGWRARWVRHATDSCSTCIEREARYGEYIQSKPGRAVPVGDAVGVLA
jgi:hypothetical protein